MNDKNIKSKEDPVTLAIVEIIYELTYRGVSAQRIFDFIENDERYKNIFNDDKESLVVMLHDDSHLEFVDMLASLILGGTVVPNLDDDSERDDKTSYKLQALITVFNLIEDCDYSELEALKIWLTSKTKELIQNERKMAWLSPTRCYDELRMELSKDPNWMMGVFD